MTKAEDQSRHRIQQAAQFIERVGLLELQRSLQERKRQMAGLAAQAGQRAWDVDHATAEKEAPWMRAGLAAQRADQHAQRAAQAVRLAMGAARRQEGRRDERPPRAS